MTYEEAIDIMDKNIEHQKYYLLDLNKVKAVTTNRKEAFKIFLDEMRDGLTCENYKYKKDDKKYEKKHGGKVFLNDKFIEEEEKDQDGKNVIEVLKSGEGYYHCENWVHLIPLESYETKYLTPYLVL